MGRGGPETPHAAAGPTAGPFSAVSPAQLISHALQGVSDPALSQDEALGPAPGGFGESGVQAPGLQNRANPFQWFLSPPDPPDCGALLGQPHRGEEGRCMHVLCPPLESRHPKELVPCAGDPWSQMAARGTPLGTEVGWRLAGTLLVAPGPVL